MAKPTRKRRVKKNIESGVAHIHATFNNTIVMITDVKRFIVSRLGYFEDVKRFIVSRLE